MLPQHVSDLDRRSLEEDAAAAVLEPVYEARVVAFDQKMQGGAQFAGAAYQRNHFLRRFGDQLEMACHQVESGQKVSVDFTVFRQEFSAAGETRAPIIARE